MLKNIKSVIENNIIIYDDKPFMIYGERFFSYKELGSFMENYNLKMENLGIPKNSVVIIDVSNRVLYILLMIATILSGRIVAYGSSRSSQPSGSIWQVAMVRITDRKSKRLNLWDLYEVETIMKKEHDSFPFRNVAFILETSGSTGDPKPCYLPLNSISRFINGFDMFKIDSSNVHLLSVQPNFGAATIDIWGTVLNGATLVLGEHIIPTQDEIYNYIRKYGVNFLNLSAPMLRLIIELQAEILDKIKTTVISGDFFPFDKYKEIILNQKSRLIHAFGCSEYGSLVAAHKVSSSDFGCQESIISIGNGIAGANIIVVSQLNNGQYVQSNKGELAIRGNALAVNLNKIRVLNEFGDWYLTRDKAYKNDKGEIVLLGRKDDEIKVRGFRVSLSAIKAVTLSLQYIENAAVITRQGSQCDIEVILFIECNETYISVDKVIEDIGKKLPKYMIPTKIIVLENIPVTERGKIDKKKLLNYLKVSNEEETVKGTMFFDNMDIASMLPPKFNPMKSLISQGVTSIELIKIYEFCHRNNIDVTFEKILSATNFFELRDIVGGF